MKIKCLKCPQWAVWQYDPGPEDHAFCNNCVPRGCSCQLDDAGTICKDDYGRELPCVEYSFSAKGFEEDD